MDWDRARHDELLAGVREVGCFQLEHFGDLDPESVSTKSGQRDLVSWVDTESEGRLVRLLGRLFPSAGLLGEEQIRRSGDGEWLWIIDPLDGTTNYAYQIPFFAISVALVHRREPVLGIIHAPRLDETYHGYRGAGAWMNDAILRVSARRDPSRGLYATGFADARQIHARTNLRNLDRMIHATRGVRRAGSACLDLAFTAAGRLDAFWEMGLNPWDVAAGIFLVREAGGQISDLAGRPDAISGHSILASNGHMHAWLLDQLELDPHFDRVGEPLL